MSRRGLRHGMRTQRASKRRAYGAPVHGTGLSKDCLDDREAEALDVMYGCNGSSFTRNSRRLRPLYGLAGVGLEGARC